MHVCMMLSRNTQRISKKKKKKQKTNEKIPICKLIRNVGKWPKGRRLTFIIFRYFRITWTFRIGKRDARVLWEKKESFDFMQLVSF